jgi:hypothetical protein
MGVVGRTKLTRSDPLQLYPIVVHSTEEYH